MGINRIHNVMDTRNSRRVMKVKEDQIKTTEPTLPENNTTATKATQNHYDLRNGKMFLIQPSSKSAEEYNTKCPKCPRITHKISNTDNDFKLGAKPLGKKGYLSLKYDRFLKTTYISQLFCEKSKIGEGSFGAVYAYYSYEDQKKYAIKIMPKRYVNNEIKNLDTVDGWPYCIQYYNAWEEDRLVYIQMELGVMSLADYAQKNHNISEEECWNILHDVMNALKCLHTHNYVHMDIKPENIVITPEGNYKLCDFGLLYNLHQKNKLLSGEGDGKYIASEILQGIITTAGDIFSVGISILELVMDLLLPKDGDLWHEIRDCDWRTVPKGEKRRISTEMEQLINWMMSSQADQRPSALQLLEWPSIRIRSRSKKTRFNYFDNWYQSIQQDVGDVPTIVVNHDNTFDCSSNFDLDAENENLRTPPRRISSIILCDRSASVSKHKQHRKRYNK